MKLRHVAVRLSRLLARGGMNTLLDPERRGASSAVRADGATGSAGSAGVRAARRRGDAPATRPGTTAYPYRGDWKAPLPATSYAPRDDGRPDPGEVVWAWVPYEEDHGQGKDRPVLVVARHPELTDVSLALPLTSKDHDRDAAQEARAGRHWMDVGAGAWDGRGRPSEVRLDRILQLDVTDVRREGSRIDEQTFAAVIAAAQRRHAVTTPSTGARTGPSR